MKFYLSILFSCVFAIAQGQESMKGYWRVDQTNGNGVLFNSVKGYPFQTFGISPTFSKFVGHKTLAGIGGTYSSTHRVQSASFPTNGPFNWHYFGMSAMIRKYFGNKAFKSFIGAEYNLAFSKYSGNQGIRLEEFDLNFGPGLAYFVNDQVSIDLAFDFKLDYDRYNTLILPVSTPTYPNSAISVEAFGAWDLQYVPNISLTTNIYIPFSDKTIRQAINPIAYQRKGNRIFGIVGSILPRSSYDNNTGISTISSFNSLSLSYQKFVSNILSFGGGLSTSFFKSSLRLNGLYINATQYIDIPKSNLQAFATWHSRYNKSAVYDNTTGESFNTYELNNGIDLGIQYRIANNLVSLHFGNMIQSATAQKLGFWGNRLIQNFGLECEHFLAEKASFFVSADVIPNSTYIGVELGTLEFIPFSRWDFGCGYRVYFVD